MKIVVWCKEVYLNNTYDILRVLFDALFGDNKIKVRDTVLGKWCEKYTARISNQLRVGKEIKH